MGLDAINAAWVAEEVTFGVDPSADGSGYLPVTVDGLVKVDEQKGQLETAYQVDDSLPTAPEPGPDGWQATMSIPARGLTSVSIAAAALATVDADDIILKNIFGTRVETVGHGVGVGSDADTVVLETSPPAGYAEQYLMPIYEAALVSPNRTMWALIDDDSGSPTMEVRPNLPGSATTAAEATGTRNYRHTNDFTGSLAFVFREDDSDYVATGGKVTSASLTVNSQGRAMWALTVQGDRIVPDDTPKTLLPVLGAVAHPAALGLRSCFNFNGSEIEIANVTIDLNLQTAFRLSQCTQEGRAAAVGLTSAPTITIDPLYSAALYALRRDITTGPLLYSIGAGVHSGGRANACAFHAEAAYVSTQSKAARDGERGLSITFAVVNGGVFSGAGGGTAVHYQFSRT